MDSMSNNWSGMGNNWSWGMSNWGGMNSMGNWGMSNNWGSMDSMSNNWSGMGNNWSWCWLRSISWGWLVSWSLWVGGSTLIGDISNISIITIRGVGHMLDSTIGKSNGVGSLDIA